MKKNLNIRASKPTASILNKSLIIALAIMLALLLIFLAINSFAPDESPRKLQQSNDFNITSKQNPYLKNLPENYQDSKNIAKYLTPITKPKDDLAPLKTQITQLENSQTQLQSTISQLQTQLQRKQQIKVPIPAPQVSPAVSKSPIFFSNTTPDQNLFTNNSISQTVNASTESSAYEQQNMQNQKIAFLNNKPGDIYDIHSLVSPISPYEVQAGSVIPAILLTSVNTSLPGTAIAQVKNNVYDSISGKYTLIPKGTKMIGQYDSKIAYGQERILIVFTRLVMPSGNSIQLSQFAGTDTEGDAGLGANVDNHWARVLGAATISTVLSIGAGVASDNMDNRNTFYRSATQNAALGAADNISSVGQSLTNRAINIQPTLSIPAGYEFDVIVNKDMVLKPAGLED